ncbi:NrfD/PsrC family molybdoenzyme membrane anchor subunit [Yimella sp. cx-51]|uniref:NrfD/PsrC family molybdoenzyme membrane anchor subunit n=1 Tax=Yimella sp. cx-51 TaxID=2770551 RepID=UPI00165EA8E1|nr:NrfD/PsrC family molybdoenzyme membrane anchor subunit [Yimella sp. cx-51]MBC9958396.1 polysulfide reductase NrfD [Yimella sp. cx-51]QTH38199.1 polysulfide reductase NrfD [Yimella sp. cx-51]
MSTSPYDADRPPMPARRGGGRKKKRGGDPHATVPDAQFTSYYGRNVVKPPPWENDIAAYLFLGGLAAGSALLGAGGHATGRPQLQAAGRYGSLVAVGLGGYYLVHDLGRPERALNMMRTVKLTSPMSVGSWILTCFGTFAGASAGLQLLGPKLASAAPILDKTVKVANPISSAGVAFFAPPLAAYTAVLLSNTAAPTWHESYRHLPFIFVSSALAAGCGWAMVAVNPRETGPVRALGVTAATVELVLDRLLDKHLGLLAEPRHEGKAGKYHTYATAFTVIGAIGAALSGRNRILAALSGASLMAGSAFTRFAIFEAGMESAKDPRYTIVPQRERAAAKLAKGQGITQPGGAWPK